MQKRSLGIILLFVFLDLLGYSLLLPVLPVYAAELGSSALTVGLLIGSNALTQFVATPVFGRLSDRYGRRPLLVVSVAGTLFSFSLLAISTTIPMLFVSRILDGLLGGNVALARAYIADSTDEESRTRAFGLVGAAFGIGFIIGPALGGLLSSSLLLTAPLERLGLQPYAAPALLAAGLAAVNLLLIIRVLPESLSSEQRNKFEPARTAFTGAALIQALKRPCVGPLLITRFFYSLAFGLFQANFSLWALYRLGLDERRIGFVLTYVGILVVLVQGVLVGQLAQRYNERRLIVASVIMMCPVMIVWAFVHEIWLLLLVLAPIALATGVVNTLLGSYLSKVVYREEIGGTLGIAASLEGATRILAPIAGGLLLNVWGTSSLGLVGGTIMGVLALYVFHGILGLPSVPHPGCQEADSDDAIADTR